MHLHSNGVWLVVSHFFVSGAESTAPVYLDPFWSALLSGISTTDVIPRLFPCLPSHRRCGDELSYFSCSNCKPNVVSWFCSLAFCHSYPPPVPHSSHTGQNLLLWGLRAFPSLLPPYSPWPCRGLSEVSQGKALMWGVLDFRSALGTRAGALLVSGALIRAPWTEPGCVRLPPPA